jgi:hypothetical protein
MDDGGFGNEDNGGFGNEDGGFGNEDNGIDNEEDNDCDVLKMNTFWSRCNWMMLVGGATMK